MKMKTITTKWAMLIALVTAFSCTETETGIAAEKGKGKAAGGNTGKTGGCRTEIDNQSGGKR